MSNFKYRKKAIEIEAFQFDPTKPVKPIEAPPWFLDAMNNGTMWYQGGDTPYLTIKTLEGDHRADVGDWIIRGVKGELYPCKPDIFAMTYDEVTA